jgi:serpin B
MRRRWQSTPRAAAGRALRRLGALAWLGAALSVSAAPPSISGPPGRAAAAPASGPLAAVAQASNGFGADLYRRLAEREPHGNLFFSPASLSLALSMASGGARGETARGLARVLHAEGAGEATHAAWSAWLAELAEPREAELSLASRLWVERGEPLLPDFEALARDRYRAPVERLDFGQPEPARARINGWVAQQTHDRIRELIPRGALTRETKLVLGSAVYFKGLWERPFDTAKTAEAPFWTGEREARVQLMSQARASQFGYAEEPDAQLLELAYKGGLSMLVVLPTARDGLPAIERRLTGELLARWVGLVQRRNVLVSLPRFRVEQTFSAGEPLAKLGAGLAFSRDADFSGIDGRRDLRLSAVIHKAFVEVNEAGTEAAAATGVVMGTLAVRRDPVFRADHPFLYCIVEQKSGALLFLGRFAKP